ncbi:hypothetical protein [Promicromonospora sp. NPDC023805]|uniref:hypothetical protein n=1 Tax=Promicromonospora sp. NPDC023805 TaxID=3154696 RepID=UPI0033C5B97B
MTLACISMSPGEPMEIIDPTVVRADNRAALAELAQTAADLYDTRLDLLSDLPEPPTREAQAYVADFRKAVKGAKSSWELVASSAESKDVPLKNLRAFVQLAGMTTMMVNTPVPPEPGPLAEAYEASWRCSVVR